MKKIIFISNYAFLGKTADYGMSGGDRIFIELIKHWQKNNQILLFGTQEAIEIAQKNDVKNIKFLQSQKKSLHASFSFMTMLYHAVSRLFVGVRSVIKYNSELKKYDYVYSVSDFYPDVIPALILKLKNPQMKWIAAFYFFAPKPWNRNNPYKTSINRWFTGLFYWLTQILAYKIILKSADYVILCNQIDEQSFINDGFAKDRLITIYGGVDIKLAQKIRVKKIEYEAVFMARFHSQKGPLEAVRAWREVVKQNKQAKLIMIGNGPEETIVNKYIDDNQLKNNIILRGFVDGIAKYKILKASRIYLHSAVYETGGMAAAEAMAAGLPVIAYNHQGYDYIYPKGMIKVDPVGDYKKMAKAILSLLKDKKRYQSLKKAAYQYIRKEWDWSKRADFVYKKVTSKN